MLTSMRAQRVIIAANRPATHIQRPDDVVKRRGARLSSANTNSTLFLLSSSVLIHVFKRISAVQETPYGFLADLSSGA